MANGYVPHFMRPNPLVFPPQPAPQPRKPPSDPSLLFSTPQQNPQCRFPSAFPADGSPNIIQRFWIRLFGPPVRSIIACYRFLSGLMTAYRDGHFVEYISISSWPLQISEYLNLHTLSGVDADTLTIFFAENRWSILIGLLVVVLLSVAAWVLSPKGENQTYVLTQVSSLLWICSRQV
jgi:hypothetical protein